jgi:hypothetical protein
MSSEKIHDELIDHKWIFNSKTNKYRIDFLVYPKEISQKRAYYEHRQLVEYFTNLNDEDCEQKIIH